MSAIGAGHFAVTIPGPCVPYPRPRPGRGGGRFYQPEHYTDWRRAAHFTMLDALGGVRPLWPGDVTVSVEFLNPHKLADIDNLAKSVLDALTGVLLNDDRQVVELHCTKRQQPGADPVTRVSVRRDGIDTNARPPPAWHCGLASVYQGNTEGEAK